MLLGLGWMESYFCLEAWSLNSKIVILPILVLNASHILLTTYHFGFSLCNSRRYVVVLVRKYHSAELLIPLKGNIYSNFWYDDMGFLDETWAKLNMYYIWYPTIEIRLLVKYATSPEKPLYIDFFAGTISFLKKWWRWYRVESNSI